MKTISPLLSDVEIDRSQTFKNLSIYPLISATGSQDVNYALFCADGDRSHVKISENPESLDESNLEVEFKSDRRYLILDGDELQTQRDTYISRVSAMIPAGKTATIPVCDLAQGRWVHEADTIQHSARKHFSKGTFEVLKRRREVPQTQFPTSRSFEVTIVRDLSVKREMDADNGNSVYVQNKSKLQKYLDSFTVLPSQIGAIFVVNGKVAGAHIFENETIFSSQMYSLIECYAADPIRIRSNISKRNSKKAANDFLSGILDTAIKPSPTPGEGEYFRFDDKYVIGGVLIVNHRIVHLCAIPESATVNTAEFRARKERAHVGAC